MNKLLLIASLAVTASAANAGITVTTTGSPIVVKAYNGVPATVTGVFTSGSFVTLGTDEKGTVSATYLGSEAADKDQFAFTPAGGTLTRTSLLGDTVTSSASGPLAVIPFAFSGTSKFSYGSSFAADGTTFTSVLNSFALLGTNVKTAYGTFAYVLGFNDKSSDRDFDDFVVGINFSATPPVPEPSTYALMLAGLGAVGFLARRRKQDV